MALHSKLLQIPAALFSDDSIFFLMLKGAKLRLDAEIDSLAVSHGEFIVLVPFTRKSAQSSPAATPGEEQSSNPPISPEVAAEANSAWQDIMEDLSSIPSSPHAADAASKDLCSGSYAEDVSTGKGPSTGRSVKKRKIFKENGTSSRDTSGVDSASEQPSMNKKNGFVKSAASSCHVGFLVNFTLASTPGRIYLNCSLVLCLQTGALGIF
jgi:DEAD/DEAH box helicase domain-containing protein